MIFLNWKKNEVSPEKTVFKIQETCRKILLERSFFMENTYLRPVAVNDIQETSYEDIFGVIDFY